MGGYRNKLIQSLHASHDWGFSLMPFDSLTRERWDFHSSTIWFKGKGFGAQFERGVFISDCTHWCFSPRFWELVTHDMYVTLSNSTEWLRRRHVRTTRERFRLMDHRDAALMPASFVA